MNKRLLGVASWLTVSTVHAGSMPEGHSSHLHYRCRTAEQLGLTLFHPAIHTGGLITPPKTCFIPVT